MRRGNPSPSRTATRRGEGRTVCGTQEQRPRKSLRICGSVSSSHSGRFEPLPEIAPGERPSNRVVPLPVANSKLRFRGPNSGLKMASAGTDIARFLDEQRKLVPNSRADADFDPRFRVSVVQHPETDVGILGPPDSQGE